MKWLHTASPTLSKSQEAQRSQIYLNSIIYTLDVQLLSITAVIKA